MAISVKMHITYWRVLLHIIPDANLKSLSPSENEPLEKIKKATVSLKNMRLKLRLVMQSDAETVKKNMLLFHPENVCTETQSNQLSDSSLMKVCELLSTQAPVGPDDQ